MNENKIEVQDEIQTEHGRQASAADETLLGVVFDSIKNIELKRIFKFLINTGFIYFIITEQIHVKWAIITLFIFDYLDSKIINELIALNNGFQIVLSLLHDRVFKNQK